MAEVRVDAVVIGRNEGPRLIACLDSLAGTVGRLVYVDSGSTDGSVVAAKARGAEVVILDREKPFTAARARNAGLALLAADPPTFVQMVDGDCSVVEGWIAAGLDAFRRHPKAVVVCGRRRERFPDRSVYNRLADREWETPVGPALACGGDALIRFAPLWAVGGYREALIAGEEPELCLRLRRAGGEVWRIDHEMTLHDAAILHFGQWWRRTVRAGHAFAEGAALHGMGEDRHWVVETRRAVLWGALLPLVIAIAGLCHPLGWGLLVLYPAQLFRLAGKGGLVWAFFTVIGKFAEAQGVLGYWLGTLRGKRRALIEYK